VQATLERRPDSLRAPLDLWELTVVNRLQGGFPLGQSPFAVAAAALETEESCLIKTIRHLLGEGWLTRFGPLFNAERMGGGLTLAALAVPEQDFQAVAARVNAFPEVAHNYRRDHHLNMWFVLATETPEAIGETLGRIEAAVNLPVYNFPKEREFYLGLWLEIGSDGSRRTRSVAEPPILTAHPLDLLDRRIVAATQEGLPLIPEPWQAVAETVACELAELTVRLQAMIGRGLIRRIGAVPNHYQLGFRGNGMTVWDIPDDRMEAVGAQLGSLDFVSHCYARPRHRPVWPYNLFAMVHAGDRVGVQQKVGEMARLLAADSRGHEILYSSAVLKKTGLRLVA